jgi:hypothetical protein
MEVKRKRRRRSPRKVLKRLSAGELMQVSEFRRWRYHAPDSLKRQAFEIIRQLVRPSATPVEPGGNWAERVGKKGQPAKESRASLPATQHLGNGAGLTEPRLIAGQMDERVT